MKRILISSLVVLYIQDVMLQYLPQQQQTVENTFNYLPPQQSLLSEQLNFLSQSTGVTVSPQQLNLLSQSTGATTSQQQINFLSQPKGPTTSPQSINEQINFLPPPPPSPNVISNPPCNSLISSPVTPQSSTTIITDCSPSVCKNLANALQLMIVCNLIQNVYGNSELALQLAAPIINEVIASPAFSCGCQNPLSNLVSTVNQPSLITPSLSPSSVISSSFSPSNLISSTTFSPSAVVTSNPVCANPACPNNIFNLANLAGLSNILSSIAPVSNSCDCAGPNNFNSLLANLLNVGS